jgi:hypothetical protein
MAKLPRIRRFVQEDYPSQNKWIGRLFDPLNQFIDTVFTALNKGLTFRENMRCVVKTLEFVEGTGVYPLKFNWDLKGTGPTGLIIARVVYNNTAPTETVGADWEFDGTSVSIKSFFGLTASEQYKITVIAFTV